MGTDGGFKHIKVTPAEEQEIVIHAGSARTEEAAAPVVEAEASAAAAPQTEASSTPAAKPQAAYRGTTLEDIQSSKMPRMQVAIIVIAVLAIIAFAVWYAFFS